MKLIETYKSPNFNERKFGEKFSYLILHYTAMLSDKEALSHMCEKRNKVSAHFLVSKKGDIFYLVDVKKRAWHAGLSYWKGEEDMNSSSIGIEIDNSGYNLKNENFNILQINSLCNLIDELTSKYQIPKKNILGHSDIAPFRKIDPGEKFPWFELYKRNLSYLPKKITMNANEDKEKNNYKFQGILNIFKIIGYDTRNIEKKEDKKFILLMQAYQRHYRQSNVLGKLDEETVQLIHQHYRDVLT